MIMNLKLFINLLKLKDNITLKNCLLVHDYINQKLPESFDKYFILQSELNTIHTRQSSKGSLFMPHVTTEKYGVRSIKHQAICAWNHMIFLNHDLTLVSKIELNFLIKKHFTESYKPHQSQQ